MWLLFLYKYSGIIKLCLFLKALWVNYNIAMLDSFEFRISCLYLIIFYRFFLSLFQFDFLSSHHLIYSLFYHISTFRYIFVIWNHQRRLQSTPTPLKIFLQPASNLTSEIHFRIVDEKKGVDRSSTVVLRDPAANEGEFILFLNLYL